METILMYFLLATIFGFTINIRLNETLQEEEDLDTIQLFNNKIVKYLSIFIVSIFWIVVMFMSIMKMRRGVNKIVR